MLRKIFKLYSMISQKQIGLNSLFFITLVSSFLALIQIFILRQFASILSNNFSDFHFFYLNLDFIFNKMTVIYCFILISFLIFIFKVIENYLISSIADQFACISSAHYFSSFINSEFRYLSNLNLNEIKNKFTLENNVYYNQVITPSLLLFSNALSILFLSLILIFFVDNFALVTLFSLAFSYFLIVYFLRTHLKKINTTLSKNYLFLSDFISLAFFNVRDIKLRQKELFYENKYLVIFSEISKHIKQSSLISNLPKFFIDFFAVLIVSAVTLLFIQNEQDDLLQTLAIIVFIGSRFLPQIQQSYKAYVLLRSSIYAYDSLNDYSKFKKTPLIRGLPASKLDKNINFKSHISLKNISFSYPTKNVFSGFNLTIRKGRRYKLAGPSGSGKSTLINIIMGLLNQTSGSIYIDKIELNQNNITAYQNLISQVSQTSYFIKGTVSQNVSLDGNILFDSKRIIKTLKVVGFYKEDLSANKNLNFAIEEFGVNLSGGQRQRLAIARALYNQFDILILDEATNALDKDSESFIFKNIAKYYPDITLIYISHNAYKFNPSDNVINISK